MLHLLATAIAAVSGCGLPADPPREAVTPIEAIRRIGTPEVLVRMTVQHAKDRLEKRGLVYLDSEKDYKHPDNLGVAISAKAAKMFRERGITDPAAHFRGKTIEVRGCVMVFDNHPFLPVLDPKQIRILKVADQKQ